MYNQYIILSDAKPGFEAAFDDWYHFVHMREVMAPRIAAIAAQCFRHAADLTPGKAGYRQKFLCLYENSDPEMMTAAPGTEAEGGAYGHMLMSSAADTSGQMGGGYYDTVVQLMKSPGAGQAALVIEWIEADRQRIGEYIPGRLATLLRKPEILSAWLGKASAHQLYAAPRPAYVGIYHVASIGSAKAIWNEMETAARLPATVNLSASCFTPVFERVTRMQVLAPDAAMREQIAKARAAVR